MSANSQQLLERKIQTAGQLDSIVSTMKALAATSLYQYEHAVDSLTRYDQTVELGFQILLRARPDLLARSQGFAKTGKAIIVVGSDQGLCGALNERLIESVVQELQSDDQSVVASLAIGHRLEARLSNRITVEHTLPAPRSPERVTDLVQEALSQIESWQSSHAISHIDLFFNQYLSGTSWKPVRKALLPFDMCWLQQLAKKKWSTRMLPTFTLPVKDLSIALTREHLFVSLSRSFTESLASAHAARLLAMQAAQKGIEERLEELQRLFHQARQSRVTDELLEVVSGAEVLSSE